jgi:hypothetical protein
MGKRGPAPKPETEHRRTRVSVYFSADELVLIDQRRGGRSRAHYLRDAGLGELPAQVPPINREAWQQLARTSGLLNQYVTAITVGNAKGMPPEIVSDLRDQVQQLRRELLGISDEDEADEV